MIPLTSAVETVERVGHGSTHSLDSSITGSNLHTSRVNKHIQIVIRDALLTLAKGALVVASLNMFKVQR